MINHDKKDQAPVTFKTAATADELKQVFDGVSPRTMREQLVVVKPNSTSKDFVLSVGSEDVARLIAGKLGIDSKIERHDGNSIKPYVITETPFSGPTTLKRTEYGSSYSKATRESRSWTRPLPDSKVQFSEYRIGIPGDDTRISSEMFAKAFNTPVMDASKASDAVHDMVMRTNGIGTRSA